MIVLDGKQLYTVEESAALLGASTKTIHREIREGELKAVLISGKRHVAGDELKAAAERPRKRKGRRKNGTET